MLDPILNDKIYNFFFKYHKKINQVNSGHPIKQCFKTRTGPTGRPGTWPTRAWDRSGWRQKPARELARENPVDPGPGPPGQTRVRPGQFFFLF
jgi:hypothetical protein